MRRVRGSRAKLSSVGVFLRGGEGVFLRGGGGAAVFAFGLTGGGGLPNCAFQYASDVYLLGAFRRIV